MVGRTFKARVVNGRLEIEESAHDYPEGAILSLVVESEMDEAERAELDALLLRRAESAAKGNTITQEELYNHLGWSGRRGASL